MAASEMDSLVMDCEFVDERVSLAWSESLGRHYAAKTDIPAGTALVQSSGYACGSVDDTASVIAQMAFNMAQSPLEETRLQSLCPSALSDASVALIEKFSGDHTALSPFNRIFARKQASSVPWSFFGSCSSS